MRILRNLLVFISTFIAINTFAQTASQYAFTTGSDGTMSSMAGSTQLIAGGGDDTRSAVTTLPFTFRFCGVDYTQFSVNSNGLLRFGATQITTTFRGNNWPAASSTYIVPFGGDLATASTGKVHIVTTGTSPNRVYVIEWLNMEINYSSTAADGTFQCRLYETTNQIEFIYANMRAGGAGTGGGGTALRCGISTTNTVNNVLSVNVNTNATALTATPLSYASPGGNTTLALNSTADGSRKWYKFTPPPVITNSVASLTAFSACVNIASSEQSFTVSGTNLTANVTVTAPTGFQVSTTSGSGFGSSVTLTQSSGTLSSTTVYARMAALASSPTAGNITSASTSATTQNISVSGVVNSTGPGITANPSNASVLVGGNTSFSVTASGSPTSYTWQVSTDGGTSWSTVSNGGVYTNATTSTLNITAATIGMNGYKYKASATNCVSTSSYSTVATLTVTYCTPTYSLGGSTDYITQVTLPGNSTTLSQATASNVSPYYINYTSTQNTIPQLTKGTTYSLSITFGTNSNQYNGVWIDLNQDGTLSTSEFFTSNTNAGSSGTAVVSLAIPVGASTGQCLMRVRGGEDSQVTSSQSCGASSSSWGQAQDYYVTIAEPLPPTITSFGSSSACGGGSITINGTNLSGVTASNVTIGGTAVSSITTNTSTQIVAVIGSGTTGTVSVTTAGGTVTYGTFTVNSAPTISYTGSPFSYPQNSAISNLTPTTNSSSFSVIPTLPTGLSLNASTGVISGTPTVLQSSTSYTITATSSNSCTTNASINIAVTPTNTTCSSATTLSCGTTNGTTVGTTGVASGLPIGTTFSSGGISDYGVWYKFTGDGNSWTVVVTPESAYDPQVVVVSGSCGTYTAVDSDDSGGDGGAETLTFTTTNGVTYYIYVAHYSPGNTTTGTFTINLTSAPSTPTGLTGTAVICSGQTGTYSVTNVGGMTYNWTLPSGWSGSSSTNSITVTPDSNPGMIAVTATNSCGTSASAGISASVSNFPTAVSAGSDVPICSSGNTSLSASVTNGSVTLYNTDANYATNWSTNDVNRWTISNTTNAGGTNREFRFNYYLNQTGVTSTLGTTTTINATNYTSIAASFRHSVDWFSNSNGFTLYFETSPDNTTWTTRWSVTPTADISYPGGAVVNVDLSALNGTTFYVRYRFTGNTARINDWYIDNLSITGTPNVTYSWINTTTGLSATNVSNPTASPSLTTTYTVQATTSCVTLTDDVVVTVNTPSVAPTTLNASSLNSCSASNVTLTQTGGSLGTGAVWQWYSDANFTTTVGSTLSSSNASLVVSPTSTTTYYLRSINGTSPCSASIPSTTPSSVSVTVTIGGLVSGTHNTTALSVCDGFNPTALTITAPTTGVSPYTYQWKINGNNATTGTGSTTLTYDDTALAAGTYTYTCVTTDACGSSVTSSGKTITVVADPSVTNPSSLTQCLGDGGSISVTGSGGTPSLSYQWYSNTTNSNTGGTLIGSANTNTYTPSSSVSGITYYYCIVSATGSSCNNSTSGSTSVTINGPSVSSINSTTGQTIVNGDYVWNGSSTTTWATSGNWYKYNGSTFDIATTDPTTGSNVFVVSSGVSQCISSSNSPTLINIDDINNLTISSGSTLTLSNTLSVTGNVKIDGSIDGTGTIKLNGTGTQNISGTGTITIPNLEVNKSSGNVTLSNPVKVSNTLTMVSGNINNGSNLVEVGTSTSSIGSISWSSGTITGPLKRWFAASTNSTQSSGIFPVGNSSYNRYAQINFTSTPTSGGSITTQYVSGLPSLVYSGLPLTASDGQIVENYEDEGYWDITPDSYTGSLSQATYNIELRGNNLSNPTDISVARIIKSEGPSHTTWSACGTHGSASGTISDFTINSTSNTGFSFFNIGSTNNSPLPIELLSFTANCSDDGTLITWTTASESNTSHFNLEKSRNGIDWEIIHTEQAAGNSTQLITYGFMDKNVFNDVNYYRLNQYDLNGVYEKFGPISINCLQKSNGYFSVFPNPSSNSFNIMLNNETLVGDGTITITDDMGRAIYDKNIEVKPGINLYSLDKLEIYPGVYYISVKNGNFTSGVLKQIIK